MNEVPIHINTYQYISIHINPCQYIPIHVDTCHRHELNPELTLNLSGPVWTKRQREHGAIEGDVLLASRGFLKEDEDKREGCVAQGLHCNIWNRAQSPKLLTYTLKGGGGHCPGARRGTRAFQLQDVMWKPGM